LEQLQKTSFDSDQGVKEDYYAQGQQHQQSSQPKRARRTFSDPL